MHLVGTTLPGTDVFFLDTGYHFAETLGTRDAYAAMLPIRIRTVAAAADRRRAGRRVRPEAARPRPRPAAARCARSSRSSAPSSTHQAWVTGMRREDAPTRTDIDGRRLGRPARQWSSSTPSRRGPQDDVDALRRGARGLPEPAAPDGLRLHRLRPVHPRRRRGRGPARGPLVRAATRPNAGCTHEHDDLVTTALSRQHFRLSTPSTTWTTWSPRRSTSSARSPASSSGPCSCSAAARTRS